MGVRYTLCIGNKNISSWSLRPWLVMKMANIAFDEVLIKLQTPESKARIEHFSPSGKVPALKIEEDGASSTVWDSLAICETLAERHRDPTLWPENPAERTRARCIAAEMHSGFPELRKVLPMDIASRHATPALNDQVQSDIARIIAIWTGALQTSGQKGGFLFGKFSIADAFFAPVVTRFETYGIHLPAIAQAYAQRVLAVPPMREWSAAAKAEAQQL